MRQTTSTLLGIVVLHLASYPSRAVEVENRELGTPLIRNYAISEFAEGAEGELPQVWSVTQDNQGLLYFGLWRNITQFDGQRWNLIPVPSGPVYGLDASEDGTVYVALVGDFGYLKRAENGELSFVSLRGKLPETERKVTAIWSVHVTSHGVYFVGAHKTFRFFKGEVEILKDEASAKGFSVLDRIYLMGLEGQISVIDQGSIRRVPYFDDRDRNGSIGRGVAMPWQDGKTLIATTNQGLFVHDVESFLAGFKETQNSAQRESFLTQLKSEVDDYLRANQIYSGQKIDNTRFALGTRSGGIAIIDNQGRLMQIVNRNRGLIDNLILHLAVDHHGNLIAGTNGGIALLATGSPVTVFDQQNGLDSMIVSIRRHGETLHLGTMAGNFILPPYEMSVKDDRYNFEHVQHTGDQCFAMMEYRGRLLAADDNTIIQINGTESCKVVGLNDTALSFATTKRFPEHIFVGLVGVAILKIELNEEPAATEELPRIAGMCPTLRAKVVPNETLSSLPSAFYVIVTDDKGDLWASSEDKGIYQIHWTGNELSEFQLFHYGLEDGLPELSDNNAYFEMGQLFVGTKKGVYIAKSIPQKSNGDKPVKFVRDSSFGRSFWDKPSIIWRIEADQSRNLWMSSQDRIGVVRKDSGGTSWWDTRLMGLITGKVITFYPDRNDLLWIGGDAALFRYDMSKPKDYEQEFGALIRKVKLASGQVLQHGNAPSGSQKKSPVLDYADNSISFEFTATFYERPEKTRFQYMLHGFDKRWSDWNKAASKEYTNLPEGDYVFEVRAKNVFEHQSKPARFQFTVRPPWHRTLAAYLVFAVLGILLIAISIRVFTWRLIAAKKKLQRIVAERTEEVVRQKDEIARQRDQIRAANDALWGEMELAKKIQTVLLPTDPKIPGYEIAAYMKPADEVGGDYYDVINVRESNWLLIGDVSGHGVPAGLVMMMVQTSIHTALDLLSGAPPAELLAYVNRTIYRNIEKLGEDKYMTVTVLSAQENGRMYYSGLHQDIHVYRKELSSAECVETNGMWIGILDEIEEILDVEELFLNPGDVMLLFTDGIVEAKDANGAMFSNAKLIGLLNELGEKPIREIERGIINALDGYKCDDDVTFMIVRREETTSV